MNPQLAFVARLRRERQRRGISLHEISRQTRVKPELFEAFESNDLTDWPRGLYARAWIRGYARAVGLEPSETVDEFCRLYLHGDRRAARTMLEIAVMSNEDPRYQDVSPDQERRRGAMRNAPPAWHAPITHPFRVMRARITTRGALYFVKPGRTPRTSS
jgi:cytoskeletal protein RodZ